MPALGATSTNRHCGAKVTGNVSAKKGNLLDHFFTQTGFHVTIARDDATMESYERKDRFKITNRFIRDLVFCYLSSWIAISA